MNKKTKDIIKKELKEYFSGKRKQFTITYTLSGTEFQLDVWSTLLLIPYGETITYKDLAVKIGRPKAVRAVGTACGKNPLPIIIPCHRVVPSFGGIGNYVWGSKVKKQLIDLEKKYSHS